MSQTSSTSKVVILTIVVSMSLAGILDLPVENFLPTETIGKTGEIIYLESDTTYSSTGTLIILADIVTASGTTSHPDGITLTLKAPLGVEIAGNIQTGNGIDGAADINAGSGGDITITTAALTLHEDARLETGDGGVGLDASLRIKNPAVDLDSTAQDGGQGGSINLEITEFKGSSNFRVGNGGNGGNATIIVTGPPNGITATARGGNGGSSGWIHAASYASFELIDVASGGNGGDGGHAVARFVEEEDRDSDQVSEGNDPEEGELVPLDDCTPHGAPGDDDPGSTEPADPPHGSGSSAYGGNGCDGGGAQPNGGEGGDAVAIAGDGGAGIDFGGGGGQALAVGGNGGNGATGEAGTDGSFGEEGCWPDTGSPGWDGTDGAPGGLGGNGGSAKAEGGNGGYGPVQGGRGGGAETHAGMGGIGGDGGNGGDGHNGDPPGDAGDGGNGGNGGRAVFSIARAGNGGPSLQTGTPGAGGTANAQTRGGGSGGYGGGPGMPGFNNAGVCSEVGDQGVYGEPGDSGGSTEPVARDGDEGHSFYLPQPPSSSDPQAYKRGFDDGPFQNSAGHGVPLQALSCAAEDRGVNQSTFWSPTTILTHNWNDSPCIQWDGVRSSFDLPGTYPYAVNVTDNQSSTTTVWGNVTIDPITSEKSAYCTATCEHTSIIDDDGSITFSNTSTAPFDGVLTIHSSNTDSDDNITQAVFDPGSLYDPLEVSTHFNVSDVPSDGFLSILTLRGAGNNIDIGINASSPQLVIREGNRTTNTTHNVTEGDWHFLQASLTRGTLDVAVDGAVVGTFYTPLDYYVENLTAGAGPRTNATLELAHLIASNGDLQNGYAVAEGFDESTLDPAWTTTGNVYLEDNEFSMFTPRETHALVLTATTAPATAQRALNISASSVAAEFKFLAPSNGVDWANFSLIRLENATGTVFDVGLFDDNLSLDVTEHHTTEWNVATIEPDIYNTLLVRTLGDRYLVLLNDEVVGSYHLDWRGPVNLTLGGESGQVGYDDFRIGNVQYLVRELLSEPGWREPNEWVEVNTYEDSTKEGDITVSSGSARIESPDASALEAGMVYIQRTPAQPVDHFAMDFWFQRPTSGLNSPDYNRLEVMTLETNTGDAFGIGFKTDSTDLFNLTDIGWAPSATGSSVTTGEWGHYEISADLAAGTVIVHKDGVLLTEGSITGDHLAKIVFGDRVNDIDLVNNRIGSGIGLWDDLTLLPLNHAPTIAVDSPIEGANITSGNVVGLGGTAWDPDVGDSTKAVEFRVGNGNWTQLSGTTFWSGSWDTTGLSNGQYTLSFRASDGRAADEVEVTVNLV